MKPQKSVFLPALMLIVILSSGCGKSNSLQETSSSEASPTSLVSKVSPTSTSKRIIISATPTPIARVTSSPSPDGDLERPGHSLNKPETPTRMPTTIPTLPVENARLRFLDLLATNGACRLPCLWGITPGKSTYQEARALLEPLSSISDFTDFGPGPSAIDPYYTEDDLIIYTTIRFLTRSDDDIVNHVAFNGRAQKEMSGEHGERGVEDVFNSAFFGERLRLYMLPQILSEYGRPDSVLLLTLAKVPPSNREPGVNFNILLLYSDQGILVHYTTEMSVVSENVVGCPANAHVELELYPSGNGDSFFDLLTPTGWPAIIKNNYRPIEKATSMTLEEFYQTFRQPTDECLETPSYLWLVPER